MEIWHIVVLVCSLAALVLWRNRVPIRNWYRAPQAVAGSVIRQKLPAVYKKSVSLVFWIALAFVAFWIISMPISCLQSGVDFLNARMDLERDRIGKERERIGKERGQLEQERKAQQDVSVSKLDVPSEPEVKGPERTQMRSWWNKYGRPAPNSGWERMYTEVKVDSSGQHLGMVPLINTAFWEGYELQIRPRYGFDALLALFSDNVDLIDSHDDDLDKSVLASLGSIGPVGPVNRTQIASDTGLVWVRTDRTLKEAPGSKIGFNVKIVEPTRGDADRVKRLVRDKRYSVRYAYHKKFRSAEPSRLCSLPLQMVGATEELVRVNFDLDVTLARSPKPGEGAVPEPKPDAQLLEENEDGVGAVMLRWVDHNGQLIKEVHAHSWHMRLASEEDVRPYLPRCNSDGCPYVSLLFKSTMPVEIFAAVRIGGKKEHRL